MNIDFKDNNYYIVPNSIKEQLLRELEKKNEIYQIHFDTLEGVKEKYFFKVKEEALLYLLEEEPLDVARNILSLLPAIEQEKDYHHKKLQHLKRRKKELSEKGFLIENNTFQDYIKTKNVIVMGYPLLEPYEEEMLKKINATIIDYEIPHHFPSVIHYSTIEEEVEGLANAIRKLNQDGVSYHKIFLAGVEEEYLYSIKEVFFDFDIPINLESTSSLFPTILGQEYFKHQDITKIKEKEILPLIKKIEDSLLFAENSSYYPMLLEEALKKTKLPVKHFKDAVTILEDVKTIPYLIKDDEYLFVVSFNQNKIPTIFKDEEYLSDKAKEECSLMTVREKNKKMKQAVIKAFSSVKNLSLSYKDTSLQDSYSKSSLIDELNLTVVEKEQVNFRYSTSYNKKQFGELLDFYYTYNEEKKNLTILEKIYKEKEYRSFSHAFKPFPLTVTPLMLSYSHLDDFALCPFRYYLKYILKLEPYEESFATKLGTVYHEVLSKMYDTSFDFETSYQNAVSKLEWDKKEAFFLKRLKEELRIVIDVNQEEEKTTFLTTPLLEEKIVIPLMEDVSLKGFLDKILLKEFHGKTYYAIFDYKTGSISLNFDYLSYGLHMQLPLYVLLLERSGKIQNPVFAGLFYQRLLHNTKDMEKKKKELRLIGVVASEEETLELLDENYKNSTWIKNLSVNKSGSLNHYLKTMSQEEKDEMLLFLEEKLKEFVSKMKNGEFYIRPKIENKENISCRYCKFASICFHDENDNVWLKKIEREVK